MEILILKLVISCYILPIIAYYFLVRYLYNSKIWDKNFLDYMLLYLMFVPVMNIIIVIDMSLEIIKDKNKENNKLSNLCYGTALENAKDRHNHLKTDRGEKIGTSKLSNIDVEDIRNSKLSQKELSKIYNVSIANISLILNFKSRKNG